MTTEKIIPVFSAIDLAEKENITKQAIHSRIRKWEVQSVLIRYKDTKWKVKTWKFYLSDEFQIIHNTQIVW